MRSGSNTCSTFQSFLCCYVQLTSTRLLQHESVLLRYLSIFQSTHKHHFITSHKSLCSCTAKTIGVRNRSNFKLETSFLSIQFLSYITPITHIFNSKIRVTLFHGIHPTNRSLPVQPPHRFPARQHRPIILLLIRPQPTLLSQ